MKKMIVLVGSLLAAPGFAAEDLGSMWGTADAESKYYPLTEIPIPPEVPLKSGSFDITADGRLAVGTRKGDVYFIDGAFESPPRPTFHLFASGQDDIVALITAVQIKPDVQDRSRAWFTIVRLCRAAPFTSQEEGQAVAGGPIVLIHDFLDDAGDVRRHMPFV